MSRDLMDGERLNTMEDDDDYGDEEDKQGEMMAVSMDEFKNDNDEGELLM